MPAVTCVGHRTQGDCDMGIYEPPCCPHKRSGTNEGGTRLLAVGGANVHLAGHTGPTGCPHGGTFLSTGGSSLLVVEGAGVTLVGHQTRCMNCGMPGQHVAGNELLVVAR